MVQSGIADIDECLADRNMCLQGRCKNTIGSYICDCNDGFDVKEGEHTCTGMSVSIVVVISLLDFTMFQKQSQMYKEWEYTDKRFYNHCSITIHPVSSFASIVFLKNQIITTDNYGANIGNFAALLFHTNSLYFVTFP